MLRTILRLIVKVDKRITYNIKCRMQNAKCKMQNAKCVKCKV